MTQGPSKPEFSRNTLCMQQDVSIVIPAFNEAQNLPTLIAQIHDVMSTLKDCSYECIVADDASTDDTGRILRELTKSYPALRCVRMTRNSGQSAALIAGMRLATGKYLITLDADLQNNPADIPSLLEALRHADCVCGYRQRRHDSLIRRFTSFLGNRVRRWIVDDGVRDAGCGIKGFRRNCLEHIVPFHGVHRFFASMVRNGGLTVVEVPVTHRPRVHGKSKYGFLNRVFWVLYDFLGVAWLRKRYLLIDCEEEMTKTVANDELNSARAGQSSPSAKIGDTFHE